MEETIIAKVSEAADEVRTKPIPLGFHVIGFCGKYSKNTDELMFSDFLIWKPPRGLKVKLRDYELNPPAPRGIKLE